MGLGLRASRLSIVLRASDLLLLQLVFHKDPLGGRGEGGRGLNTHNEDLVRPI